MYTIEENVRIVISLLKEYNIKHIVISPGGTNIPVTQAVQDDSFFTCYSVTDERSAMYFAIGLYLQLGTPIATSCTSAQATRNYIPGLTEAFYKHVPILAITTSKLSRYTYQDYMQAPDQTSLPKDSVKKSFDLPYITDENSRAYCIRQVKEAMLEITHRRSGPVQLNIRISDKENGIFNQKELPHLSPFKRYMAWDEWTDFTLNDKRILIVIGEHLPFSIEEINLIEEFAENHNVTIYINNLSNYHGKYAIHANLMLSTLPNNRFVSELKPDILITIGGQTGDYPLFGKLSKMNNENIEHWSITEDGHIIDTYNILTKIFECPIKFFFNKLKSGHCEEHTYFKNWERLNQAIKNDITLPLSNISVAKKLHKLIPHNSYINFAILNSLRAWNYFQLDPSIKCFANVAAFGIDGCMSTLIGESINTTSLCFLVTGDLAFFYDMNSLGIKHIGNNIRILLINNNGGAEFKIMAGKWNIEINRYISASGHNSNAEGWAKTCNFDYLTAQTEEELDKVKHKFINPNDKPIILEIFTQACNEQLANEILIESNKQHNIKDNIKNKIIKITGERNINKLKEILHK